MIKYAQILLQLCVCLKVERKKDFFVFFLAEFLVFLAKEIVLCQSDLQINCSVATCNCLLELLG